MGAACDGTPRQRSSRPVNGTRHINANFNFPYAQSLTQTCNSYTSHALRAAPATKFTCVALAVVEVVGEVPHQVAKELGGATGGGLLDGEVEVREHPVCVKHSQPHTSQPPHFVIFRAFSAITHISATTLCHL